MAEIAEVQRFRGNRMLAISLLIGGAGSLGVAAGLWTAPAALYFAYLTAFAFVTSVALGALIFLMTLYVVRATWGVVIRGLAEAMASVFPVLALLFVPLAFGLHHLYPWAEPTPALSPEKLELLAHKRAYLNAPFFLARTGLYFAIWITAASLLRRRSLARDGATLRASDDPHGRERGLSAALLPPVALALTFAAFDWLMSLDPFWISSIFGVYYFAGGFVASFGLLTLLAFFAQRTGQTEAWIRPPHFHALGRLMLGFTAFWAYSAFFQAMLIQIANKPSEVAFYLQRTGPGWNAVVGALIAGRFALPFLFLLPRAPKFRAGLMALAGAWILVFGYLDVFWLVIPAAPEHGARFGLWDLTALAAIGGLSVGYAAFCLRGKPLVPLDDPLLELSAGYRSPL